MTKSNTPILEHGGRTYTHARVEVCARAAHQIVVAYARADIDNGGGESVKWDDLDLAYNMARKPVLGRPAQVEVAPMDPGAVLLVVDDRPVTKEQAIRAVLASDGLRLAYEAGRANSGSSIDWTDVDNAYQFARESLDAAAIEAVNRAAQIYNGFEADASDSSDSSDSSDDDGSGESGAACAGAAPSQRS